MLKSSPDRQCEYIQLPLPIFFFNWVVIKPRSKKLNLYGTGELQNKLTEFRKQLTAEQTKSFDELAETLIRDFKSQEEICVEHNIKVYKFLDSVKYLLSQHKGGDRKLKALRNNIKKIVSETFGDY